jgi:hypothetical protein
MVCFPLVEYFPVNETAAPKIILSPTTFANEIVEVDNKSAIAEINVIIKLLIFIYSPSLI